MELGRAALGSSVTGGELAPRALAVVLGEESVAVCFRRVTRRDVEWADELGASGNPALRKSAVDHLYTFLLRGWSAEASGSGVLPVDLTVLDLGPIEVIDAVIQH